MSKQPLGNTIRRPAARGAWTARMRSTVMRPGLPGSRTRYPVPLQPMICTVRVGSVTVREVGMVPDESLRFADRREAGWVLAEEVTTYLRDHGVYERPLVLGMSRGGVPVAAE